MTQHSREDEPFRPVTRPKNDQEEDLNQVRDLKFLSQTAAELSELETVETVFDYIADRIREIVGDAIVTVSSFDPVSHSIQIRAIACTPEDLEVLSNLLGIDPVGGIFPVDERAEAGMKEGRLGVVKGGFRVLLFGTVPPEVCDELDRYMGTDQFYGLGFNRKGVLLGNAVIMMRNGAEIRDLNALEAFIGQAAVALHRGQAEDSLRKTMEELERRVQKRTAGLKNANEKLMAEIEERRQIEQELLRIHKLESLGVLAGGIAHDFNNILTAVLGNISLAIAAEKSSGPMKPLLVEAEKGALEARNLTRQLLAFASGNAPVRKPASISGILKETTRFVLSGSAVRGLFSMQEDLWPVRVDTGQISQVVNNLVINARDSMPEGGTVTVGARNAELQDGQRPPLRAGRYVHFAISDTGKGIPVENKSRVFEPYFTTKNGGSGLGLAICYRIVKRHEGHITISSEPGKGTAVEVFLPCSEAGPAPAELCNTSVRFGRGRILVVDDERVVRDVCGGMLRHLGYEPFFANDGAQAAEMYESAMRAGTPYDLVIMDLTIPGGVGGREAMERILSLDPCANVLVSSGYSQDPVMSDFERYGFKGIVAKPYRIQELSEAISAFLTRSAR